MKVIKTINSLKKIIKKQKQKGEIIGFVPTMGALHKGHISLVKAARKKTDFVVVSIFVNPTQFGKGEDFSKYPRTINFDKKLLIKEKVDILFLPSNEEMYKKDASVFVDESFLSKKLCGKSRPSHFKGVCTVVCKFFNIVEPDISYFGQKDYQQACIVKNMVKSLNFSTLIKLCPIVRESDGLAMSSRNKYLNKKQRKQAACLSSALKQVKKLIKTGENDTKRLKSFIKNFISKTSPSARIDYVDIVDCNSLESVKKIDKKAVILAAVFFGKTRLIDNEIVLTTKRRR